MRANRSSRKAEPRLDPVRWPRLPGRASWIRALLVTALLVTAAGVLYGSGSPPGGCAPAMAYPSTSSSAAGNATPVPPETGSAATAPPGGRLALPPGTVGVPVRLSEPATVDVLRPGDRIDLLAVPSGGPARVLARNALILVIGSAQPDRDPVTGPAVIILALTAEQAKAAVEIAPDTRLGVIVRG